MLPSVLLGLSVLLLTAATIPISMSEEDRTPYVCRLASEGGQAPKRASDLANLAQNLARDLADLRCVPASEVFAGCVADAPPEPAPSFSAERKPRGVNQGPERPSFGRCAIYRGTGVRLFLRARDLRRDQNASPFVYVLQKGQSASQRDISRLTSEPPAPLDEPTDPQAVLRSLRPAHPKGSVPWFLAEQRHSLPAGYRDRIERPPR